MDLQRNPKLGSLFDGSGGFPLAGAMCGIEPVWASEVDPYPIAVTRERFPNMKHLGDISKINGSEIEPVDIITFGSPCQDLSVAGKRAGLKHESNGDEETTRSGLFMEAVRIIKEMRDATNGVLPRFALWENVPGAFSSNKGEDFRIVLEELIKIAEPDAVMPPVPEKGWAYADCYIGDGWSIAYRVFDAQYWGVPQRRRRIHLVADFRGQCAGEVLFKLQGLRGNHTEIGAPWEGITTDAQGSVRAADQEAISFEPGIAAREGGHIYDGVSGTLRANAGDNQMSVAYSINHQGGNVEQIIEGKVGTLTAAMNSSGNNKLSVAYSIENHPADSRVNIDESGKVQCLTSRMGTGGGNVPMVLENHPVICLQGNGIDRADTAGCNGKGWREDQCYTLNTIDRPGVVYGINGGVAGTLDASYYKGCGMREVKEREVVAQISEVARGPSAVCHKQEACAISFQGQAGAATSLCVGLDVAASLVASKELMVALDKPKYIVRRLTPTECARLQGFPDYWGHFPKKDSMTEEEYSFWLEVRNTHARINGKAEKEYTKDQMLTWYNKLHTDSAEYKMWGNGIALPPALYCMQGIVEALTNQKTK